MDIINKAIQFGKEKHKGQLDDNGEDYFSVHCLSVFNILKQIVKDDDALLAASLLHDVLEDTETTYDELSRELGKEIADLVNEVTHEGQRDHKGYFFPRLKSKRAIIIKFADRLSNLSRIDPWPIERQNHYIKKSRFWKMTEKE
jgi:(p)ppGpp synthase/HD superfamily hydrolase